MTKYMKKIPKGARKHYTTLLIVFISQILGNHFAEYLFKPSGLNLTLKNWPILISSQTLREEKRRIDYI